MIAAIERLKSYQVEFNTLTVINNVNVHYPHEVYHFLKSIGSKHMQFIELLETGTPNIDFSSIVRTHSVSLIFLCLPRLMASLCQPFLCNGLKTMWVKFSSVSLKALSAVFWGMGIPVVFSGESCKDNLVVESNGDIYECDHFVYPQYKIGNINKSELKTMNSVQLTAQKKRISAKCQQCAYKPICNGGCPKHRITKVNNETVSLFFAKVIKSFFQPWYLI